MQKRTIENIEKLKKAIKSEPGLSQTEYGKRIGLTQSSVSRLIRDYGIQTNLQEPPKKSFEILSFREPQFLALETKSHAARQVGNLIESAISKKMPSVKFSLLASVSSIFIVVEREFLEEMQRFLTSADFRS